MPPVRIAVQIHPQHADYGAIRHTVEQIDELGVDLLYTWDHFYPLYGDPAGKHFECWTMLAAWAEATHDVALGPLVACNSYRNPNLVADMARTIDHISGGRFVFGIGAGWFRRDYHEYGYGFGTTGERLRALERDLPTILARWDALTPGPLHRIPVMIGGVGPTITLRLVARFADTWHAMFPDRPDETAALFEVLDAHCAEAGRDRSTIECAVGVEPDDLERFLREDAEQYLSIGVTQFTLGLNGPDHNLAPVPDWLAWRDDRNG